MTNVFNVFGVELRPPDCNRIQKLQRWLLWFVEGTPTSWTKTPAVLSKVGWNSSMDDKPLIDVSRLEAVLQKFAEDRDWMQYHSPKNLAMVAGVNYPGRRRPS